MRKTKIISNRVYGVGINDYHGPTLYYIDGKEVRCPFYTRWRSILSFCYSERVINANPSYEGCYVCDDWIYFSRFRAWMEKQDWEGSDIHRDFPFGRSRCYSPETCIFLPTLVSGIVNIRNSGKSELPLGVYFDSSRNKFRVTLKANNKTITIGRFDHPNEAHKAWLIAKAEAIKELLPDYENNQKIYSGIKQVLELINRHIKNDIELKGFN